MKSKPTNPWAALDSIIKREAEPIGEEWFTAQQFAERYRLSIQGAHGKLNRLVSRGILKKWCGVSESSHRSICKYRLVTKDQP